MLREGTLMGKRVDYCARSVIGQKTTAVGETLDLLYREKKKPRKKAP